jgi:hypothetical protein
LSLARAFVALAALALAASSTGCKNACDQAIDHLDACGVSSLGSSAADAGVADAGGADGGAPDGGGATQEPATTCSGVLECDAKCISQASCDELARRDPHGSYQLCLEQCAAASP